MKKTKKILKTLVYILFLTVTITIYFAILNI